MGAILVRPSEPDGACSHLQGQRGVVTVSVDSEGSEKMGDAQPVQQEGFKQDWRST